MQIFKINSPVITFVVCSALLICFCSTVAYIANYMDPDQVGPLFASVKKSCLKCTGIYAANVKSGEHFQDEK